MTISEILHNYRDKAYSPRDQGTRFERLMRAYLLTDPKYSVGIQQVYLWNDFPYKDQFGAGGDIGIDLAVVTKNNKYWAVQCKCRQATARIDKTDVDTFLATSGKKLTNDHGRSCGFCLRLFVSTTNFLNRQRRSNNTQPDHSSSSYQSRRPRAGAGGLG